MHTVAIVFTDEPTRTFRASFDTLAEAEAFIARAQRLAEVESVRFDAIRVR